MKPLNEPMPKNADRIEVNPDVHHGNPVIAGTRVPVFVWVSALTSFPVYFPL